MSAGLEEERAIRDLVAGYADAVDRRDADAWAATWAPDAVWDLGGGRVAEGRVAIVALWQKAMAGFPLATQQVFHGVVTGVDGDEAAGWWSIGEVLRTEEDGPVLQVRGRYDDAYRRLDGRWHFAERHYRILARW